ncbi:MAG TPA: hypothetical protein VEW93_14070 [Acidimicrobiales bacterium]|nr:hypothetical protein [Acidimicrobiales bacterium]
MKKSLATITLAALVIVGCSDDDPSSDATTTTTSGEAASTEPLNTECVPVAQDLRDSLGAEVTGAVEGPPAPGGPPRWYYSTSDGATWISASAPDGSSPGFTYPVNDEARSASEVGADVEEDSPALQGVDGDGPQAERSRECATDEGG